MFDVTISKLYLRNSQKDYPHNNVKTYIEKLVEKGYKIAICEQLEDPKTVKGTVKRGVVDVISKGSVVNLESLNEHDNNYIASVLDLNYLYLITYADISTGELKSLSISHHKENLTNEILHLGIKEVILENNLDAEFIHLLKNTYGIEVSISSEYLTEGYEELINSVSDLRVKQGIRHLLYYLVVKEYKDYSLFKCSNKDCDFERKEEIDKDSKKNRTKNEVNPES